MKAHDKKKEMAKKMKVKDLNFHREAYSHHEKFDKKGMKSKKIGFAESAHA